MAAKLAEQTLADLQTEQDKKVADFDSTTV